MNKEFKNVVLPVIKGLPIIILLVGLSIYAAKRAIQYSQTIYQANASVKIDNRDASIQDVQVFNNGLMPMLSNQQNFLTEVEVFKSKRLRRAAFRKLNFGINYYRIGEVKEVELFRDVPFSLEYTILDSTKMDKKFYLEYLGDEQFLLKKNVKAAANDTLIANQKYIDKSFAITLKLNKSLIEKKASVLNVHDVFAFKFNSLEALVASVHEENFFVKPVDKEISILKVYYKHEIPEKAQLFTNTLIATYINKNKTHKSNRSGKTLRFISKQLATSTIELKAAEANLAGFKSENNIINANQETDVALKKLMQLDLQKVALEMQEVELRNLFTFIETGGSLNDFSPNFEALKDGVLKDAYLKVQAYELQKIDLLNKYAKGSDEIRMVGEKIDALRVFIGESARKTMKNLNLKKQEIIRIINNRKSSLQKFPDKERQLVVLEREIKIKEQLYNHLIEKQTELAIAESSEISLHQIIDEAELPKSSIWPNKPLIYGVFMFFALFFGLILSYLLHFLIATVKSKEELSHLVNTPILGTIKRQRKKKDPVVDVFSGLYTNLEILRKSKSNTHRAQVLTISSMKSKEGKTHTAANLARAASAIGRKVLLIDLDMRKPDIHKQFGLANEGGVSAILRGDATIKETIIQHGNNLDVLVAGHLSGIPSAFIFSSRAEELVDAVREDYDLVIFDTPAVGVVPDALLLMQNSDVNIFVLRRKTTRIRTARALNALITEWNIPNIYTILNYDKRRSGKYYYYPKSERAFTKLAFEH